MFSIILFMLLMKCGLYSNILVKIVHKGFPGKLLNKTNLSRGEWVTYSADVKSVKVQVNNLKVNDMIRSVHIILVIQWIQNSKITITHHQKYILLHQNKCLIIPPIICFGFSLYMFIINLCVISIFLFSK